MKQLESKVVLVDIEGTTSSIQFVHTVLFPLAKKKTNEYLKRTWNTKTTKNIVEDLRATELFKEFNSNPNIFNYSDCDLITEFIRHLIDNNKKVTPMKVLQGKLWAELYATQELHGHVYKDVPVAFEAWRNAGLNIAVYSSGSVEAQKLIFRHSIEGDLSNAITAYFDTNVGHKQEERSYVRIAKELLVDPNDIIFLTDVVAEAAAARIAGMQTVLIARPGNAPLTNQQMAEYDVVEDFTPLCFIKLKN